ncbi:MAG: hypothetical protein H6742_09865 [Alphaproteobacteria bacterium]|nr:hypothetical protein [Alphaproteobacteria bacterium]
MSSSPAGARWVRITQATLVFVGLCYLALGVAMVPLAPFMLETDQGDPLAGAFGVILFFVCAVFGAFNFVVAWGLGTRAKWAWIAGIVLGAMYAPSGCMPFGVAVLYGLLCADGRAEFD